TAHALHSPVQRERAVGICERLSARSRLRWFEGNEAAAGNHTQSARLQSYDEYVRGSVWHGVVDSEECSGRHSAGAVELKLQLQLAAGKRYQAVQSWSAVSECLHLRKVE